MGNSGGNWPPAARFINVFHRQQIIAGDTQKGRTVTIAAWLNSLAVCEYFFISGDRQSLKRAC